MAKEIALTQGKVALVSDEDYEWLMQWKWHANSTSSGGSIYAYRSNGVSHPKTVMHRAILERTGAIVSGESVEHINGNGLDNRRENLRKIRGFGADRHRVSDDCVTIGYTLPSGETVFFDTTDQDLAQCRWHKKGFYAARHVPGDNKSIELMHRVILSRSLNRPLLPDEVVDHADGNPMNNRRSNLRLATTAQNVQNMKRSSTNTSGYKGVTFHKRDRRWQASIKVGEKSKHLGYFATAELAHEAYKKAAVEYFGEFARFE